MLTGGIPYEQHVARMLCLATYLVTALLFAPGEQEAIADVGQPGSGPRHRRATDVRVVGKAPCSSSDYSPRVWACAVLRGACFWHRLNGARTSRALGTSARRARAAPRDATRGRLESAPAARGPVGFACTQPVDSASITPDGPALATEESGLACGRGFNGAGVRTVGCGARSTGRTD